MAGIIKAATSQSGDMNGLAQPFQFGDMGNAYLQKVQVEAAAIIKQARDEAAKVKAQAMEDGKRAAIAAAEATLKTRIDQQLQTLTPTLQNAVQQIQQSRQAWQRHWEQHALKLSLGIASRVIRRQLAQQPEITLDLVKEGLELAVGHEHITVRLNPADHAALGDRVLKISQHLARLGQVQVVSDPQITSGGCRIDTEFGNVDQRIETQLDRIAQELGSSN
ncbi:Yop proteins translocation protein L [Anatilimnocola aggregata]|uniref:Flagellar assembly protein FliH n=1 Tax=Anatilimnocola aggregata TaxID=2528021 RepID=A0A517Y9V3_9BACT|nr:FliH/SctL family protein [Anatilimnocola aggregata]QDU26971.1 Yop proteins translocation protein L [Anatilimnocola aggregata]